MHELTRLLFRGVLLGLSIAAPVGPIGVLCIRRTLSEGSAAGLVSGLGAATADAIYGCVAGFGLTLVSSLLVRQQFLLRLTGGLLLCYLGVRTFLAAPARETLRLPGGGLLKAYAMTLVLTLANPMTIFAFAAIFASLGLADADRSTLSAGALVGGVFLGSALWWLVLSSGVNVFRARFSLAALRWVNRLSGFAITGFGLFSLFSLARCPA